MKQYCRYCVHALDYNGEATDFVCMAKAPCGNNGAGQFYKASEAKRPNKCKYFEFNPMDVFYTTYGEREYKPRQSPALTVEKPEQMKLF
ncbi:MAG: hypothetical protein IIZ08_08910 [Clostridia bacterium]|nr:hypothetical protein [Clostridia bacterium]